MAYCQEIHSTSQALNLVPSGGGLESNAVYVFPLFTKDTFEKANHPWMRKNGPLFTARDLINSIESWSLLGLCETHLA